jgi:hypothetical protein
VAATQHRGWGRHNEPCHLPQVRPRTIAAADRPSGP